MIDLSIPNISSYCIKLPLSRELSLQLAKQWLTREQRNFAAKRIESFIAGRHCAQQALLLNQTTINELASDLTGRPVWPGGFCGSISHTKTLAIAIVSRSYKSLGVDVEALIAPDRVDRLTNIFINDSERHFLRDDKSFYGTLIFSAKESLFKLINPLCQEYFGFTHADLIACDQASGTFQIELKSLNVKIAPYNRIYSGHYILQGTNIVTVMMV